MATLLSCPNREQLHHMLLGLLPDGASEQVEEHLHECESCIATLAGLGADDTLIAAMRAQPAASLELAGYREQVEAVVGRWIAPGHVEFDVAPAGSSADERASEEAIDFLAPAQAADELGRLGSYRVLRVLGAGGMGIVFEAEDLQLKRRVALKAMKPALAASASARKRFVREAQAAASVEHDHIVPIYQVGEDRGIPFIAMPLLRGETLADRMASPLATAEVVRIGREAALGLDAAHRAGLIHRDIKPANIWLETAGGRVKILDFGLARAASADEHLTHPGALLGTPSYMAPEQGKSEEIDARADLFSLGCVLYHVATGVRPFVGRDALSTLLAVTTHQPRPPRELNPQLPVALNDLIVLLLSKDPAGRPPSAREVVERLSSVGSALSGAPEQGSGFAEGAGTQGVPGVQGSGNVDAVLAVDARRAKPPRRRSVVVAAAAAAVLLLGVVIVIKDRLGKVVARVESENRVDVKVGDDYIAEVGLSSTGSSDTPRRRPAAGEGDAVGGEAGEAKEAAGAAADAWGTLTGKFVVTGAVPRPAPLIITKDKQACGNHPLFDESLLVDDGGGLKNVVVFLADKTKVAVHPDYAAGANELIRFDNEHCRFEPHILTIRTSQTLELHNSDPVSHNCNLAPLGDTPINMLLSQDRSVPYQFHKQQNAPVLVTCAIHPWMKGYVLPRDNPYVAVSNSNGSFEIKNIPVGKHVFQVWQESVGGLAARPEWNKGKFTLEIKEGGNDLGTIKVSASLFAK